MSFEYEGYQVAAPYRLLAKFARQFAQRGEPPHATGSVACGAFVELLLACFLPPEYHLWRLKPPTMFILRPNRFHASGFKQSSGFLKKVTWYLVSFSVRF